MELQSVRMRAQVTAAVAAFQQRFGECIPHEQFGRVAHRSRAQPLVITTLDDHVPDGVLRLQGEFEDYRCTAASKHGVLLPVAAREFSIPHGRGGFGQANVCYPCNSDGSRKEAKWILQALCYLEEYAGGNVVAEPVDEALDSVIKELEAARDGRTGQGFAANAKERVAIERRGMEVATQFYEDQGYDVEDVSKKKPYDLRCTKRQMVLHVEVKATTNNAEKVFITRREALHATEPNISRALFILHSIRVKEGLASGGVRAVHEPWTLEWEDTTPVVYSYVPPHGC